MSAQPARPRTRQLLAAATASLVAGCGLFGASEPDLPPAGCPPVHALIGADRVSSYRTPEERAEGLAYVAAINQVRSRCRTVDGELEVDIAFDLVVERGLALPSTSVQLSYFIATLAAPDDRLVGKRIVPLEAAFDGGDLAAIAESATVRLPGLDPDTPPSRRLVVGFTSARPASPREEGLQP